MTINEKYDILTLPFETLYRKLTKQSKQLTSVKNEESKKKFECLRIGIPINNTNEYITLENIVNNSTTKWFHNEWEFPKGRKNYKEKDIECAKREFQEETGIPSSKLQIINNVLPYEEIFVGSNQKYYKNIYYLGIIDDNTIDLTNYQETEVSIMEWKSYDECLNSIRDYNIEKMFVLSNVNNFIQDVYLI
jgi:ADP-ribose pyrophosphatase YjhB (NUDIX family)